MYFLFGNPDTKIQLSFKAKILRSFELYFGYTQVMMWQLFKKSSPMRALNYNPEFFYRIPLSEKNSEQWIDLGIIEHESNGIGGPNSRSWNRSSVRYHSSVTFTEEARLLWSIKAWVPYLSDSSSKDLMLYRGLFELNLEFSNIMGGFMKPGDIILRLYPGGKSFVNPLQGGQEITFRVKTRWQELLLPLMIQVFHGYAESLVGYKDEIFATRVGIGF